MSLSQNNLLKDPLPAITLLMTRKYCAALSFHTLGSFWLLILKRNDFLQNNSKTPGILSAPGNWMGRRSWKSPCYRCMRMVEVKPPLEVSILVPFHPSIVLHRIYPKLILKELQLVHFHNPHRILLCITNKPEGKCSANDNSLNQRINHD